LEIIKEKSRDDIDEDKYFYVSGAVFQKTVWRKEIHSEGGIPKYYEVYNILSTPISCQKTTPVSILF
jgi:hypothetical protein